MSSDTHILSAGVILVHLVSGEDIIARVEYDTEHKVYLLWTPMTPVTSPGRSPETRHETGFSIALTPYRLFLDPTEPLLIRDDNVLFTGTLVKGMETLYAQLSSSSGANDGGIPT